MISKDDVQQVASLSRIFLDKKEISQLTQSLGDVLHYIEKLESVDISNVEPTSHVLPLKNVFRKDEIKDSLTQAEALLSSVERLNESFKVPKVIE